MLCPNCATMLPDDAKFCGACGMQLAGGTSPEAMPSSETMPIGQPTYAAAQQTPPAQQMPAYAAQPAGVYAGAAGAATKTGLSMPIIGAIIGAVVVAVALIVVFVVVKPFGSDGPLGDIGIGTASPEQTYTRAFEKIASDGSFTEEIEFDMAVSMPGYGSERIAMTMSLDISDYDKNDPSKLTATGTGTMSMDGLSSYGLDDITYNVTIKNGKITMDMGLLGSTSESIDPDEIVTDPAVYEGMWEKAKVDGNVITFDLSNEEMKEIISGNAAASGANLSELDNFTFDTTTYTINMADDKITTDIVLKGSYVEYGQNVTLDMTMRTTVR